MNIIFVDAETIPDPDLPEELKPECKLGNLKDPEKIEAKKKGWEDNGQIKAMSVDTWMNQVVCLELFGSEINGFYPITGLFPNSEKESLEGFWNSVQNVDIIVGFNLINFDLPTIINRSMLLGVEPSREIALKRYSRTPVYDIAMILCGWDLSKLKKMDWYLKRFGLPVKSGDGSQVYQWHKDGKHKEISEYCRAHVLATKALFEKIIPYYPIPRNYDKEKYEL